MYVVLIICTLPLLLIWVVLKTPSILYLRFLPFWLRLQSQGIFSAYSSFLSSALMLGSKITVRFPFRLAAVKFIASSFAVQYTFFSHSISVMLPSVSKSSLLEVKTALLIFPIFSPSPSFTIRLLGSRRSSFVRTGFSSWSYLFLQFVSLYLLICDLIP